MWRAVGVQGEQECALSHRCVLRYHEDGWASLNVIIFLRFYRLGFPSLVPAPPIDAMSASIVRSGPARQRHIRQPVVERGEKT